MGYQRIETGVFVQVRLGSTRFPCKALMPLKGGNVIQHVMRSLKMVPASHYVLLTDEYSEEVLGYLAEDEGFEIFRGPKEDVLERYYRAWEYYGSKIIIRATGDNPLVSSKYVEKIIEIHNKERADLSHYLGIPLGTGVEIIAGDAIKRARDKADDPYEREHITTYMYRHRSLFKIIERQAPRKVCFDKAAVSLDTGSDFVLLREIYNDLYRETPIQLTDLVSWLRARFK